MNAFNGGHRQLLLPAMALLVLVFLLPLGWFFVRTLLIDSPPSALPGLIVEVVTSRPMLIAMATTNAISLVVTVAVLLIGYPVAYYLTVARRLPFLMVIFCVLVPYFTSIIVRTYSWMVILGSHGILNQLLLNAGIIQSPLPLIYNKFAITVGMVYVLLPYMVLTLYAAMKAIDPNLLRAGSALGGSGFYVFRHIYLPLSLHAVFSGSLIVFILAIGFFITPALLGGPSDVMVAMLIERAVEITLDWQQAAVMSLMLLVATLALYAIYSRITATRRLMGA